MCDVTEGILVIEEGPNDESSLYDTVTVSPSDVTAGTSSCHLRMHHPAHLHF